MSCRSSGSHCLFQDWGWEKWESLWEWSESKARPVLSEAQRQGAEGVPVGSGRPWWEGKGREEFRSSLVGCMCVARQAWCRRKAKARCACPQQFPKTQMSEAHATPPVCVRWVRGRRQETVHPVPPGTVCLSGLGFWVGLPTPGKCSCLPASPDGQNN